MPKLKIGDSIRRLRLPKEELYWTLISIDDPIDTYAFECYKHNSFSGVSRSCIQSIDQGIDTGDLVIIDPTIIQIET